ncbi:MAG: hypothetical protein ACYSWZ_26095 [Planctomycetota bacterium]
MHNKAIKISPAEPELYDQRRQTYMRRSNYGQALSDAHKCVDLQPEKNIYHFHAICALVALGRYDEAKAEYEKVFKADSESSSEICRGNMCLTLWMLDANGTHVTVNPRMLLFGL